MICAIERMILVNLIVKKDTLEKIVRKVGKNVRIYPECEGRIVKSVPRIPVWNHEACRVMTNGDPEGQIFSILLLHE